MTAAKAYGIFDWQIFERRSQRYGAFQLNDSTWDSAPNVKVVGRRDEQGLSRLNGHKVKVTVTVVETRDSTHCGDSFLEILPSTPKVGEVIVLGVGTLRVRADTIELEPNDGRERLWLDPHLLYRLHSQTVEVHIELTDEDFHPAPVADDKHPDNLIIEREEGPNRSSYQCRLGTFITH